MIFEESVKSGDRNDKFDRKLSLVSRMVEEYMQLDEGQRSF